MNAVNGDENEKLGAGWHLKNLLLETQVVTTSYMINETFNQLRNKFVWVIPKHGINSFKL